MSDTLIKVEGVSKKFCRDLKRSLWYGMQDLGNELLGRCHGGKGELRPDEFWAIKDVSFELKRGECLGLIGHNGAGKTTLLRMLNGLIKPDKGRIEMRGRIGSLIALGAGFNPILTGRENIYVNASVLGLNKREIDEKIEDIIDFAEIEEFIDSPVQSYSSGMQVRLGFAVASVLNPDLLLLDEVLAVGDASFRNKCYHRIAKTRRDAAIIFVSHNMDQVSRICDFSLVLQKGKLVTLSDVGKGIEVYESIAIDNYSSDKSFLSLSPPIKSFEVTLGKVSIDCCTSLGLNYLVESYENIENFHMRVQFYNCAGGFSADSFIDATANMISIAKGKNSWELKTLQVPLKSGTYKISFTIVDSYGDLLVWSYKKHCLVVKNSYPGLVADCQINFKRV